MRKGIIGSVGALLVCVGGILGQEPPPVVTQGAEVGPAPVVIFDRSIQNTRSSWGGAEFLLWRLKSPPVPVPLITINDNPASIAALNEAGTRVLFGNGSNESTNLDWSAGMRFTLGGWRDDEQMFGWEASGFVLERRSLIYHNATAGGANPVLGVPANSIVPFTSNGGVFNPAGETSLNSGGNATRISAHLNARLWGAEANGVVNLWRNDRVQVTGLVGFRYLDLVENLSLSTTIDGGAPASFVYVNDSFATRNQFYGGQVGARVDFTRGRWHLDTTAKMALGSTHQVMNLVGESSFITGGAPTFTTPQGVFVESTNGGRFNRNVFAVVPEVQVNLGYQWTPGIRPFIGYNWMYLSNAARPGDQIDRNVNPTQQPAFTLGGGALVGPPAPLPTFRSGEFWAQGFNLGVEIRY